MAGPIALAALEEEEADSASHSLTYGSPNFDEIFYISPNPSPSNLAKFLIFIDIYRLVQIMLFLITARKPKGSPSWNSRKFFKPLPSAAD
jgi:hypothetical protein